MRSDVFHPDGNWPRLSKLAQARRLASTIVCIFNEGFDNV